MSLIFSSPSKTFLQCFTLQQRQCKAKHCRNVLGRVLGQKNKIQKLKFESFFFDLLTSVRLVNKNGCKRQH